jgi:hypothetical protein
MISFKRGQGTKKSLNIGLLEGINYIFFHTNIRTDGRTAYTTNYRSFPIEDFLLANNEFDRKAIHAQLKELYWVFKIAVEKRKNQNETIEVKISFGHDQLDLNLLKAQNDKILEMLYGKF